MKPKKSMFMLIVMLMGIITQMFTTIGTIQAFAVEIGEPIINKSSASLLPVVDGNRTILTSVKMQVEGSNGKLEDLTEDRPLKVNEKFQINYTFEIPDALGKEIREGDYFEFDLPESDYIKLTSEQSGELVDIDSSDVHGTYHADKNGHVKMIFNDEVQYRDDVDGTLQFRMYFEEKHITIPEGYEINFPYVTNDSDQIIFVVGKIDSYIQKEYLENDGFTFRWKVLINPTYQPMRNLRLIEHARELGSGSALAESINIEKMVKADVSLNGDITEKEEINLSKKTFDNGATMDLGFNSIDEPYVMYINTPFPYGIKNNVENRITLFADVKGKEIGQNADAQSNAGSYIVLDKKVLSYDKENQVIEWQTTFNPNSLFIPQKDAKFRDEITNGILMEETMTVSPDLAHTVDVATNKESFDFQFNTDVNQAVVIRYKTKVKDPSIGKVRNKVISGDQVVDVPQNVEGDGGENPGGDGNSSITKSVRPGPDWANWTININSEKQQVDKWWVTDKLDSGTVKQNSVVVTNTSTNQKLSPKTDYDIEWINSPTNSSEVIGFTIRYNQPTNNSFKIEYQSNYERNTSQTNHAYYHYYVDGNEKEDDASATYDPPQVGEIGLSKSGRYIPDKREIEWTVLLNENGKVPAAENNLMRDPIMDDQTYVNGSAKVEYRDGTVWNPLNQAKVDFNEGANQLEVSNFKMTSNSQRVIFRTKLKNNIDILHREIENTAYYKDSFTKEKSAKASLTIDNANDHLLKKRGKQNSSNSDYVDWEVDINPYGFKLDNLVIIDDSWENQIVRKDSIKLVDTSSNKELKEDVDYDLEYTERYFKIFMKNRVESKLLLTYQGRLIYPYGTPLESNQQTKNSVRVTADGVVKTDRPIEVTVPVKVSDSSGTIQGKIKDLNVKKVSLDNSNETLKGAEFVLYRGTNKDPNKLVNRVTTGDNGIAHFDKLTKGDYLLVETQAPSGYAISNEMKNGRVVTIATEDTTTIEEIVANPKSGQEVETTEIKGQKIWEDNNDRAGERPTSVTIVLEQDEEEFRRQSVSSNNNWSYEFKDLPKYREGTKDEYRYTVKEDGVPDCYVSSVDGNNIINTYEKQEFVSLSGEKIWEDDNNSAGKRPTEIKVVLLQNDTPYKDKNVSAADNWKYSFTELPKYDQYNDLYKYRVIEADVPDGYTSVVDEKDIVNTYSEKVVEMIDIEGEKHWDDDRNNLDTRPEKITVNLYRDDNALTPYRTQVVEPVNGKWKYEFTNLPKTDENDREYEYEVKEIKVNDYQTTQYDDYDLLNTLKLEGKVNVAGEKKWVGDDVSNRPDRVLVRLFANGKEKDTTWVSASTNWKYKFENLDKYDQNSKEITYTVQEDEVKGYDASYTENGNQINITNTYKAKEKTKVEGSKIWVGDGKVLERRPEFITVLLFQNGEYLDEQIVKQKNGETDNWKYAFNDLEKYDEDNNEYKYTVKEKESLWDYDSAVDGYNITNTYDYQEWIDIPAEKEWRDLGNAYQTRPRFISIRLQMRDFDNKNKWINVGNSARLESKNDWKHTFQRKDKFYPDGETEIEYRVIEEDSGLDLSGYEISIGTKENNYTLVNKLKPIKTEIPVTKIWKDEPKKEDQSIDKSNRPDQITIHLLRDGVRYKEQVLTEKEHGTSDTLWKYTFKDLDAFNSETMKKYVYTIEEDDISMYDATYGNAGLGLGVTNTFKPDEKISINGEKHWDDQGNKFDKPRPTEIIVELYQDGNYLTETPVSEKDNWLYEFTDLPKINKETGKEYNYTVKEKNVPEKYTSTVEGYDIHNKYNNNQKTSVSGEKKWEDYDNQFKTRPQSIEVQLYQNDVFYDKQEVKADAKGDWKYSFTDLPKYSDGGELYTYSVQENVVPIGYIVDIKDNVITNTYENTDKTQIVGSKIWNDYDNKFGTRPELIKVDLIRDDAVIQTKEVKPDKDGNWSYEFTNLDKFDKEGKEIKYSVKEQPVSGYETSVKGNDIYNTYTNKETTEISVVKKWEDNSNQLKLRPKSIRVDLLQDGKKLKDANLSEANNWSHTFIDLEKYDNNGVEFAYTVVEEGIPNYITTHEDSKGLVTITNSLNEDETKTSLSGKKIWDDYENAHQTRPKEITVLLFQDGKPMIDGKTNEQMFQIANQKSNWSYQFTDLPKINPSTNKDYEYTIKEKEDDSLKEYETTISGTNITNKYRNKEVINIHGFKKWEDYNNAFETQPDKFNVHLLRDKSIYKTVEAKKEDGYRFEFTDLEKYDETGVLYQYEVTEEVPAPYTVTSKMTEVSNNEYNIELTNTYENTEVTSIKGQKKWDDYNNQFNTRPDSVSVQLLNQGQVVATTVVGPGINNDWSYEFNDLPKYDETGALIEYQVKEVFLDEASNEYTSEVVGNDIINHYVNQETINFKGQKKWDDYNNQFNTRPGEVTIYLYRGSTRIETTKTDETKNWAYEFNKDYPVYNEKGVKYKYTIREKSVKPYTTTISTPVTTENNGQSVSEIDLTNTYVNNEKRTIRGEKKWDDFDNQFSKRPDSITITLTATDKSTGEVTTQETTASKETDWQYEFNDLLVYDKEGNEIEYVVNEEELTDYEQIQGAPNFINRAKELDARTSLAGEKIWDDENNKLNTRPDSITVVLNQNGEPMRDEKEEVITQEVSIKTFWKYEFTDLPKYDDLGQEYAYTVTELGGVELEKYTPEAIGNDIKNTYKNVEVIDVSGQKKWNDLDNKLGKRPALIKVNLYQNDAKTPMDTQEVKPDANGNWAYSFVGLPKYDDKLEEYTYRVEEQDVLNYESEVSGYDITNTYQNKEVTSIPGEKIWNDLNNKLGKRPETIKVELYQNDGDKPFETQEVTGDSTSDSWSYEFTDLPKYDDDYELYTYTIKEVVTPGYTSVIYETSDTTIYNQFINDEKTSVTVIKNWEDENNIIGTRPGSIRVNLYRNNGRLPYKTQTILPAENGMWSYKFEDLPKYDNNLNPYEYTVKEVRLSDYTSIVNNDPVSNVSTITNKYNNTETTELNGYKAWLDHDNKLNTRPKSITVDLFRSDLAEVYQTQEVEPNEDGYWYYSFKDLPKYDEQLKPFVYTVKEQPVEHYDSEVSGPNIINSYRNDDTTEVKGEKHWLDNDNKLEKRPTEIKVELYQNNKLYDTKAVSEGKNGKWEYSFENLPKYDANLNEYVYTVKETAVDGYLTEVVGTDITNSYHNIETTQVEGKKIWEDMNNKLNLRPESITVELYQSGVKEAIDSQEVEADSDGNWSYLFKDLPKYDENLDEFIYTVKEIEVPHYDSEVNDTTITNRYRNDEKIKMDGQKIWKDEDNKLNLRPASIKIDLYQNDSKKPIQTKEVKADESGNWYYEFTDLDKYDNELNEYRYTVKEQEVKYYTSEKSGNDFVNTYNNSTQVEVEGQKTWDDFDNKLNLRPKEIFVELYQNTINQPEIVSGQSPYSIQKVTPDKKGNWSYKFTELPEYDKHLDKYIYVVKEHPVENYESQVVGEDIHNTYQNNQKTSVEGQKIWKGDFDNKIESRPAYIVVNLYQNGSKEIYQTQNVTPDADGNWSYIFTDLPKYDDELNEYEYTVKEEKVPHYESKIKGTNITNTYQNNDTIDLKGQKQWNDENDKLKKRPASITVDLYQNNGKKPFKSQEVTAGKDNDWRYEFIDLPKYDKHLNEYVYTVKEHEVDDYQTTIEGTTIINTYKNVETTLVEGEKQWLDEDNKLHLRPEVITVELYQNNSKKAYRTQLVVPDKKGNWSYIFADLPKYDETLTEYQYTVKEQKVPHYESQVDGTTITNTYQNDEVTRVEGEKQWQDVDNKLESRPESITVELYQNNGKKPFKTQEVTAGKENKWNYSFEELPKYDNKLNEYTYTVKEKEVPHYESQVEGTTITNTYRNDEVTEVKGQKIWQDKDNKLETRPETITVELYQNNDLEPFATQVVSADKDGNWMYSFTELPKYDDELNEYTYTVREQKVSHYESRVEGTTITNTYRNNDLTEVKGQKIWVDNDNKLHLRPEAITVDLYQNNGEKPFRTQEISADEKGDWNYSFTDLPKYDDELNEYEYTVKERIVPLYTSDVQGTTITNTFNNDHVIKLKGRKIWRDSDNKLEERPKSIFVELYQNDNPSPYRMQEVKADKNGNWTYRFEGLPKYDSELNEYAYAIKEHGVPHYDSSIEGTTIVNTYRNDEVTELNGQKIWDDLDNKLNVRPDSITVELYQNNHSEPFSVQEVKAGKDGDWSYSFTDLPKYDEELNEYIYTVKEQSVKHYDSKVEGTTITNTYRNDEVTEIKGEKKWQDNDNKKQTRPDSITVELYQNDGKVAFKSQKVIPDKKGNWNFVFEDLPKYDDNLVEYQYTVKEVAVKGYESHVEGTTITNKLVEEPVKPIDPTDPTKPVDPTEPTEPTDPTKPVDPTRPTIPSEGHLPKSGGNPNYLPKTGQSDNGVMSSLLGLGLLSLASASLFYRRRKS